VAPSHQLQLSEKIDSKQPINKSFSYTFHCQSSAFPLFIVTAQQRLLSDAHHIFTGVEINTPEMQQTNPQMTNAGRVLTMPSVIL